ncbi:mechanosensitive ion channel family protein [Notoacmeibacter sp. MSK16QG-6]|uniref:mechanosensitive ion channel family protein n=1 Tax=Notoacmeibacter sp. MSK16QG-6 TaxID=2957982 RepID=UPI00209D8112|nr:mechanosensitive ion channel family protein [Notoacmeibacter sp. MSK16QG-6]MCP1199221.1 mechanosensitive ion channel family protein [Notoacmeibacter sp. MSK16QG-6]
MPTFLMLFAQTGGQAAEEAALSSDGDVATTPEQIDVSPRGLYEKLDGWLDGFVTLLPNILVAVVVFALFWMIGIGVKRSLLLWAGRNDRANLGEVLGGFLKAALIVLGALLAMTIILPTLKPADLVAGLGIGSVAIGFAFKDILQNWLAGLLILIRQPFRPGDQIVVNGYEGTVDHIETRATAIRTYDGRLALVPNADVYTNAVVVNTAFQSRRSEYDVGIGYGDEIAKAKPAILKAVGNAKGVLSDPAPDVLVVDLAASWVTLRARWWTDPRRADVLDVKSDVIEAIKLGLDEAGIDLPYETVVSLFHDQTEDIDGDRSSQREGWPAGDNPPRPARRRNDTRYQATDEEN